MKKINVALIGYGFSGQTFHLPPLALNEGFNVLKVMTRSKKNQRLLLEKHPGITIITKFEEAIKDDNIDLIIIATPNNVHEEYTKRALLSGKHVVCEKPFVETYETAKELFDLAKERKLLLRIFHNRKYDGDMLTVKELIKTKDFGALVSFDSRFDRLVPEVSENWRFNEDSYMSGIYYDLAPHVVHNCIDLFGIPNDVTLHLNRERLGSKVDDHFEMRMRYNNGFVCNVGAEMLLREKKPHLKLVGLNASYVKYGLNKPDTIDKKTQSTYQSSDIESIVIPNKGDKEEVRVLLGAHYKFYENLYLDINNQPREDKDKYLALGVIKVMEKGLISANLKKTIKVQ